MKNFYQFLLALTILILYSGFAEGAITPSKDGDKIIRLSRIEKRLTNLGFFSAANSSITIPQREILSVEGASIQFERNFGEEPTFPEYSNESLYWGDFRPNENINQDSVDFHIGSALQMLEKVTGEGRLVEQLTLDMTFQLPVGIKKTIGELAYTVIFHKVRLTETNAYVDAYLTIEIPESEQPLVFMGRGIEFSAGGGITGAGKLELLGDRNIPLSDNKIIITLLGGSPTEPGLTFAEFDCYGFKELSIDAEVTFSKGLFIRENPDGSLSDKEMVVSFNTKVADWNNIMVDVSLPKFQLSKLKGWSFEVKNAVLDFSDEQNAASIKFPQGYESPFLQEGSEKLWRGFYLNELTITLPQEFKKKDSAQRTTLKAYEMIIDGTGFTGGFSANNILDLNEGNADKWKMSVNSISAEFVQNEFVKASFDGELLIPTLKTDEPLKYSGLIQTGGNYQITASLQDSLAFDLWKADVELLPNSLIELKVVEGKFRPKAVLHGNMNITPTLSNGEKGASLLAIDFQSLTIQSQAPYLDAEYFGFGSEQVSQKMAKFPITIESISFKKEANKVGLYFLFDVNLVKSSDNGFGGGAGLTVWANLTENDGIQKWKYDKLQIHEISINVKKDPGFSFNGTLTFYEDDPTYGRGFRGNVDATLGGIDVNATAIFGNVNSFRYWYVDAMLVSQTGIPVVPPFSVNGFGGGAYYHMRQQGLNENIGSAIGKSSSGIVYVPDENTYLGIKASVAFSLAGSQEALNGDVTFEVNFNKHGGVNQIAFEGNAKFMTTKFSAEIDKIKQVASKMNEGGNPIPEDNSSSIRGNVKLLFDNENDTFYGNIKVFVNVGGVIQGIGANDLAGQAIIYFAPDEWYVHIGSPTSPVGVEFLGIARTESYFMVGHNLPDSPPPPDLVTEILGNKDLDYNRNLNDLNAGKGIAFGSRLIVDTGDMSFLIFYGRFAATAGFDIMLKDYGNVSCVGRSGPIGVDGWYANGQAFVGIMATIGIKVRLKFIKKNIEIFHGAAAAVMQAQGPNPLWMKGVVGGKYRVLNGLIKGSFDFEVTIGDKCEIEQNGSPLDNIDIIADLTPQEGSKEVDVFTTPQAIFNLPINKEFELVDVQSVKHVYKAELEYFRIKNGGASLPANLIYNDNNDVLGLQTIDVFPSEKELKLEVQIIFKEKLNGSWNAVLEGGQPVKEYKSIKFMSGIEPDYIPKNNIAYSYPTEGMVNFYQNQVNAGYVKLKQGMERPFENDGSWNFQVSFTDEANVKKRSNFSYDASARQVNFSIPNNIANNKSLKFDLLRVPKAKAGAIDRNVDSVVTSTAIAGGENLSLEIKTNSAEGSIETLQEKSILAFYIRSSEFNTLAEKFTSTKYTINTGWRYPIRPGIHELGYTLKNLTEEFDQLEISGDRSTGPLVSFQADFSGNSWYNSHIYPVIYDDYPINNSITVANDEERNQYSVPPAEAIYIRQLRDDFSIDQSTGFQQSIQFSNALAIIYNIADVAERDFITLRNKAANYYLNRTKTTRVNLLLNSDFPVVRKGYYKIKVNYNLPGKETPISAYQFQLYNPVGIE
ncbi:hypothetical protein JKA74_03375 [Marivirga sp. S37H4]|uniref:TANFOR domain-containing protein n=1 Tax=Marivirga aurantiaca TaxID=2802615 RepID=A0A934WW79_9BACT|nr:hypothetical protein [Marivirga aurantiaca]MBK6264066.1 hypothetical protein [Marivirga aurantiaca]